MYLLFEKFYENNLYSIALVKGNESGLGAGD
jgi:hypothetical protein